MKIKYHRAATFMLDNGDKITGEFIGKGAFWEAFRVKNWVYLVERPNHHGTDYAKEIMLWAPKWSGVRKHLPVIEHVGELEDFERQVYRMKYYEPLTAAHKVAWTQFKALQSAANQAYSTDWVERKNMRSDAINRLILNNAKPFITPALYRALEAIYDASLNYGDHFAFEFATRNLKVDAKGNLILVDPIFDQEIINKTHAQRVAKANRY